MNRILVERGAVQLLARLHQVSEQTVRNALRGLTESDVTDRIRKDAISQGLGVEQKKSRRQVIKPNQIVQ